ncbi:MAG TPA: glycosyltransferase, partial [Candidatus Eisenbacteria bacterium]|nr:glycosyltransferase [Candidatus Eisenbacteria bacterium]
MSEKISIVVPVYNEEENIHELLQRIQTACLAKNITYEVIFIDDHSRDNTKAVILECGKKYPITYYEKLGKKGKAQSLLEGFSHAKFPLICMIDADLQYPPEAIPKMIEKIHQGAGVVVAQRDKKSISFLRRITSDSFMLLFCTLLHNLSCDVQSGLKVFKKEIIERLSLNPTPWTFDMEFILNSIQAGYSIASYPIHFAERKSGKSKVHVLQASLEIGWKAIQLKFNKPIIPFHPEKRRRVGPGFNYQGNEFVHYSNLTDTESSFFQLSVMQKIFLTTLSAAILFGLYFNWHITLTALISVITILYFTDLLFNLFVIYKSFQKESSIVVSDTEIAAHKKWPMYSILCPLYKEGGVLPQFLHAIENLSYPKNKLQVLLLLEEDDTDTIATAQSLSLPPFVTIHIVPHSLPKTKPKACNYA